MTMHALAPRMLITIATVAAVVPLAGQSPQTSVGAASFDVTSVKRYQPAQGRGASDAVSVMPGGRLTAPAATLRTLIAAAYGVVDVQIVDSARVLPTDRYEIAATTGADVTADQARAMLRTLLAERFTLAVRVETRDMPVYVMSLSRQDGRLGDQLRRSGPECAPVTGPPGKAAPPPPPPPPDVGRVLSLGPGPLRCGGLVFSSTSGGHWSMREIPMSRFAERLIGALGRPVLDRTGLDGFFDFDVTYTPDTQVVEVTDAPNAPALITAIREQLGLRLESTRAPVQVVVVESVQPPTEN